LNQILKCQTRKSTKMSKIFFLSMCDVKLFLTFTSLNLVLLWQLFYLFCSSIVINTVKYFWHFCWLPYLYTFSLYENASLIIVSAETEYMSTSSWCRNINCLRDRIRLSTKIYEKRDDFNFKIINLPNMCSNIQASPAYGAYISQLIHCARASAVPHSVK
jgi:hypothetical protein